MKHIALFLALGLLLGCKGKEPIYQGLPLKIWVMRLDAPEKEVRLDAIKVIAEIGEPAISAEPFLRQIARKDASLEVRIHAVEALDAINASTTEFQAFVDEYYAPIIPEDELQELEEELPADEDEDITASYDGDDLEYLQGLETGIFDELARESTMIPLDSAELTEWIEKHQGTAINNVINQLRNPKVLALLLGSGDDSEKLFAAKQLAEIEGIDTQVFEALKKASNDPLLKDFVEEALENWEPGE